MFEAKILLDSKGLRRLTTFEITYPRFIHSEIMTHRMLVKNSASSRAIPNKKMLERIISDPAIPVEWGRNKKGMSADEEIPEETRKEALRIWLEARDSAIKYARQLDALGLHKQIVNRVTECWMPITVIISGTEWSNFFHLRCAPDAQPEIQRIAYMMRELYQASVPVEREWHLPLIDDEDRTKDHSSLIKMSVARCARVSYLTHDGIRDQAKDFELYDRLVSSGHWSPHEHVASRMTHHLNAEEFEALIDRRGPAVDWAISTSLLEKRSGGLFLTSFGRRLVDDIRSGSYFGWAQHRKSHSKECM